jgi:hypothetical protein
LDMHGKELYLFNNNIILFKRLLQPTS